jgi:hypothetical protein
VVDWDVGIGICVSQAAAMAPKATMKAIRLISMACLFVPFVHNI